MEDKELIEKIVKFIESDKWDTLTNLSESIVQLIRSAGYVQQWGECPKCDGKGGHSAVNNYPDDATDMVYLKCPVCHGTGKVLKYAELAEDQSLPENPYGCTREQEHDGYNFAIGSMLTPHKEGERRTMFKRVYVE